MLEEGIASDQARHQPGLPCSHRIGTLEPQRPANRPDSLYRHAWPQPTICVRNRVAWLGVMQNISMKERSAYSISVRLAETSRLNAACNDGRLPPIENDGRVIHAQ